MSHFNDLEQSRGEVPLSESSVSLRLADIQERCSQLLTDSDSALELTLEEPLSGADKHNPYSRA